MTQLLPAAVALSVFLTTAVSQVNMTDVTAFRTYCHRQTGLLLIKTGRWTTSEYTKHAISRFLKTEIFRRTICSSINPPPSHTGYRSTSVPQSSQLEVHFPSTIQQIGCLSVVEGWVEHYSWNTNCDLSIYPHECQLLLAVAGNSYLIPFAIVILQLSFIVFLCFFHVFMFYSLFMWLCFISDILLIYSAV